MLFYLPQGRTPVHVSVSAHKITSFENPSLVSSLHFDNSENAKLLGLVWGRVHQKVHN